MNNGKGSGGNNNNDDDNNNSNVNSATTTIPIGAALEQPGSDNKKNTLNWLLRLTGYYGDESVNIRQSGAMYQSVLLHSSNNRALDFLGLEDSFYFNHSIIILHVWMLHRRLRSIEIKDLQQDLQEQLFDRVWESATLGDTFSSTAVDSDGNFHPITICLYFVFKTQNIQGVYTAQVFTYFFDSLYNFRPQI